MAKVIVEIETDTPDDIESFLDECFYATGDKIRIINKNG